MIQKAMYLLFKDISQSMCTKGTICKLKFYPPTVRTTSDQNRGGGDDFFGFMTNQQLQIGCYETLS